MGDRKQELHYEIKSGSYFQYMYFSITCTNAVAEATLNTNEPNGHL